MIKKEFLSGFGEIYSGLGEFLATTEAREPIGKYKTARAMTNLQSEHYFNTKELGASGYTAAKTDLLNGRNVDIIKKARSGAAVGHKKVMIYSVTGSSVSVGRALTGKPNCMRKKVKVSKPITKNLVLDVSISCRVTPKEYATAGAALVNYITDLQKHYNVNLFVGFTTYIDGTPFGCFVKIMEAGRAFSAARLSYMLTVPAFLRVFGILWIGKSATKYESGFGRPLATENKKLYHKFINTLIPGANALSMAEIIKNDYKIETEATA
jgi:hypothetical protein